MSIAAMYPTKKKDPEALKLQIKQLEKALAKANVMIYGFNAMIDYPEKKLKVPVPKKSVVPNSQAD